MCPLHGVNTPVDARRMLTHRFEAEVRPGRVVVLGASGFIARRLIRFFRNDAIPCRPIGSNEVNLLEPSAARRLQEIIGSGGAIVITSALTPEMGRDRATF